MREKIRWEKLLCAWIILKFALSKDVFCRAVKKFLVVFFHCFDSDQLIFLLGKYAAQNNVWRQKKGNGSHASFYNNFQFQRCTVRKNQNWVCRLELLNIFLWFLKLSCLSDICRIILYTINYSLLQSNLGPIPEKFGTTFNFNSAQCRKFKFFQSKRHLLFLQEFGSKNS